MNDDERTKYQSGDPPDSTGLPPDVIVSPDTLRSNRLPPGQARTRKWPVLQYGRVPHIAHRDWQLEIIGLVERPLVFTWEAFQRLPRVKVFSDFHCVTRWSRLGNLWEGVALREILSRAMPFPEAQFVVAHAYDDSWTTNMPLADANSDDSLLADTHDGAPLSPDHGGPVRLVVPRLYAWKSAKWIRAIELTAQDRPGTWERVGYHNRGNPWAEERYET